MKQGVSGAAILRVVVGFRHGILGLCALGLLACDGDVPHWDVDPVAAPMADDGALGDAADPSLGEDGSAEAADSAPSPDPFADAALDDAAAQDAPECPPPDLDCGDLGPDDAEGQSRYPIVLVHGMGGFENLGLVDYYFGIRAHLMRADYAVFVPELDPLNSTEVRAAQLAHQVDRYLACTCAEKLNFIGHSQGAIDIRYLTTAMGRADQVASLTSIAGPHRGTPVADLLLGYIDGPTEDVLNALVAGFTGIVYGRPEQYPSLNAALESCSSPARAAYDAEWPDDPRVPIYSYAGLSGLTSRGDRVCADADLPAPRRGDILAPELAITFAFIRQVSGPNDGLVAVDSARWGRFRGCLRADHLDQIGQLLGVVDSFDYRRFFVAHAAFLAGQGH